jgi:3-methyladenine DNA glycosylase AlkD
MQEMIQSIKESFEQHRDISNAKAMEKYMKNHSPFLGIRSPQRKELSKPYLANKITDELILLELVYELWNMKEREYQYLAIDFLNKNNKVISLTSVLFLEQLILQKSWWDSVDSLAASVIGPLLLRHEDEMHVVVAPWITSENLWLNRSAIIFQLQYKEKTRLDILKRAIEAHTRSKEFFHKKAIGWALRQYSKTDPEWVVEFLDEHDMQPLSVKEASKYL